ncbi:MAG TPA: pyridoxamine 5'-phosphate oxidase [Pyrinomonadaceae bacterium]|nr:pyridoxamine 5'-phosphate oxidase [Pyrinomonadaceae bacterium]
MTDISEELDEQTIDREPINQFKRWFEDAVASGMKLPEAMTLATATRDGKPSARVVLLKGVDSDGFVFYTNYRSAKARDLEANPHAALVFYWSQFDRQVRVEGTVERVSTEESRAYFKTRPRESQIGAWASPQSNVIENREVLEARVAELEQLYGDGELECPEHWGGYRVKPTRIEFWKGRLGRLHDRIVYERDGTHWNINRLAP